ncbi:helix-turn-helix domain-containing protein [Arcobacter roscoffensis]|uniref:Helix-turn-helix domain-containing protein n=1 Tax=Arcobacter roscoffensis TaxID=2961520 RepID=A0ABY5DZP3_9BACT|nr:helix-turn-helix domain-containing protein [Arcobacter roscoffensis]UTJ05419.1 helix-turn-helix domain-containing protein [Arcobacter roscoffensis]
MSAAIATKEDFDKFQRTIVKMLKEVNNSTQKEWLTKEECLSLYGIKDRTLTELRQTRKVVFSKVGNTCIYKHDSIIELIEENKIEAMSH